MLDFAAGLETKNYGLKKTTDLRSLLESVWIVMPLAVIAGAFYFHVWVHSQNINIGYRSQQLSVQADRLKQIQQQLILEEQTLKDPALLEALACENLGLVLLQPGQIISPPLKIRDNSTNDSLALKSGFDLTSPKAHLSSIEY